MTDGYCPKCGSQLYPNDETPMLAIGVCGDCLSWDRSPGRQLQACYAEWCIAQAAKNAKKARRSVK